MNSRIATLITAAVTLGFLASAKADVTFTETVIDPNGPAKIWGKGSGDLNGDGKGDFLVGGMLGGLNWYRNPDWKKSVISSTAKVEEDMAVADLNKDGRKDVIAIVTGGVKWFENTGTTSWPVHTLFSGIDLHDIEVFDFDGDGKLDIIGRNQSTTGNILYLWRQQSLTSWQASRITLPAAGEGLLALDINRDNKRDLIIGQYWFKNLSSPGVLRFQRFLYSAAAPKNAFVSAGDLNADGRVDIVTSPSESAGGTYRTSWFEAPPVATDLWTEHIIDQPVPTVAHFSGVADFDNDAHLDVATALTHRTTNPYIKVYFNTDGHGPSAPGTVVAPISSHSMKIISVDGRKCLFGADYADTGSTPVRMFCPVIAKGS